MLTRDSFFKKYFIYSWETHRGRDIGRGRSRLPVGSPCRSRSQDPRVMPWAEGRHSTTELPTCPDHLFYFFKFFWSSVLIGECKIFFTSDFVSFTILLTTFFLLSCFGHYTFHSLVIPHKCLKYTLWFTKLGNYQYLYLSPLKSGILEHLNWLPSPVLPVVSFLVLYSTD